MKKLLFGLLFVPCLAHAGTITTAFNPLGTITFSSGTAAAAGVAVDSKTSNGGFGGGSPLTWNMTLSGSNRYLVVSCGYFQTANYVSSVTVGGFQMTQSTGFYDGSVSRGVVMYTYVAPPTGSQSLVATIGAGAGITGNVECIAVSFTGVNQSNPIDTSTANFHIPGGGTNTVTWTTTVDNSMLLDVQSSDIDSIPLVPGAGQTAQLQLNGAANVTGVSTKPTTTAGSQTMTWTSVDTGIQAAIAIRPAP